MILHVVPTASPNPLLMGMVDGVDGDFAIAAFGSDTDEMRQDCADRGISFLELGAAGSVLSMANSMRRAIESLKPDVVEAHTVRPSVATALLTMTMTVRPGLLAVRHHNLHHHLHSSRAGLWGDRFVNARVDGVVAVSYAVRETCISEGLDPDRCHVALNGLDLTKFLAPGPAELHIERRSRYQLLAVGRLAREKDYPTMLRCLADLVDRGIDVELVVLGGGSAEVANDLVRLCTELNITDRVRWVGWRSDVERWMHSADVFVHATVDEAHPLVLIEALAAGLPLVATAAGGGREIVQPFHRMVPVGNPIALADGVQRILDDLASQRAHAEMIRYEAAERFDTVKMAEAHLAACHTVLHSRSS